MLPMMVRGAKAGRPPRLGGHRMWTGALHE